ncbi:MAG TPA: DoxX family protein [Candidatus Paceibacterota bacterium]|jgi:uncharacterized membrane protein YphA (DoxX/SURF4 family)|nr:DoxX family protein [Candidatus Paceibacterota bacterium]
MALVFLIARIVLGLYWLETAYNHLVKSAGLIGYAQMKGVKSPKVAIIGSGILALLGGLSIILGIRPHYGILLLVIFLLGVSFKMHAYWKAEDPMQKMNERINFTKNIALAAAILALVAVAQPWVYGLNW